ncbi:uncharacterized protein LOC116193560 [Punica granatum]|uniref:Uncharacterized protein n=2 Tax=Punica granatum TaxID=22663 RepID=A0A2I0KP07_PUNGR|nr:uncharacterized protein LOC116193560 [Punica granatum]PKI70218.1 hypothetical protein CRG98_009410 [Punica granatum]
MKKVLLFWFFLIICYELASISNCDSATNPETREAQLSENEDKVLPDGASYGEVNNETDQLHNPGNVISNVKRAKGSYGGGDLLRPRNTRSAASPSLVKASVLSTAAKHIAAGLLAIGLSY